jgi:serine/threonine protein kinase
MSLTAGTRLGPYEIVSPLGAGGMGEVYRARDTRLGREVAVKVLLPEVSGDDSRRRRFEQEARSASALNHPNIVTVYDIGSVDSMIYLAMELVEGRTVREMLADGALPSRKMLEFAVQVAEGLAKAHEAGLVHRDLKPENLIVSKDGFVKILDFGLAKLIEPMSSDGLSALPTAAGAPGTVPGTVMGTVGYMSPEQASGRDVDFRSDQFSFGSILYELATGQRAFQRNTGAETLTAIIREEPVPFAQANPRVPAPVRWIVERCLAKEPDERFASTKDLARDLRSVRDHLSETSISEPIAPAAARRRIPIGLVAAAALVIGAAAGIAGLRLLEGSRKSPERRLQRLTFRRGSILSARFAPDGRSVVYSAAWDGKPSEIFTTRPESPESRSLALSPASLLAVSPSGDLAVSIGWRPVLGWESIGTLARVSLEAGAPREVLENVAEADWSPDGKELAVVRDAGPMRRLEYPIGKALHETVGWLSHPRISPDGEHVAVLDHPQRGDNLGRVIVLDRGGKRKVEGPEALVVTGLAWARSGREVWSTGGGFRALSLSGKSRIVHELMGDVTIQDIGPDGRVLVSQNTWRREIVGLAPGETAERNLTWLNWSWPTGLSNDGRTVLFDEQNLPTYLAYLRKTDGAPAVLLGQHRSVELSPDGNWALVANQEGTELSLLPTGAGQARKLPLSGMLFQQSEFFPDGRRILICGSESGRGLRLYVYDIGGTKARAISPEGVSLTNSDPISPDGRTAFAFGPDRRLLLYPTEPGEPRPLPGLEDGELAIRWTGDGRALWVYRTNELPTKVYRLDVTTGKRTLWKELTPPDPAGVLQIAPILMTPDGKSYVYSYRRTLDELFLVEGLK